MSSSEYFPILGKAEVLSHQVPHSSAGVPPEEVWTFDEARERLLPQLEDTIELASQIPDMRRLDSGVFFSVDIDHKYIAKSYFPKGYFDKAGWDFVGSIKIDQTTRDEKPLPQKKQARRLYFKAPVAKLEQAVTTLRENSFTTEEERKGLQKINQILIVPPESKLINLDQLESNILELIVHPMREGEWADFQDKLFDVVNTDSYPRKLFNWVMGGGINTPRFVPVQATSDLFETLAEFNPVRSIRPMPRLSKSRATYEGEIPASDLPRSSMFRVGDRPTVGVFDGGVDLTIPHLAKWVVPVELTNSPVTDESLQHGTGVCGTVLYGDKPSSITEEPQFDVKSFRVLPEPYDPELPPDLGAYQLVKLIEETVVSNENADIKTYVLSFGPDKPVEDDEIDLFTSTLDRLAYEHDVLFVVAVGNSGRYAAPNDRIQPPADAVNALGVGAYILDADGNPVKASYSSVGPGRSGNAIKPDVHLFGGDSGQMFEVFKAGGGGACTLTCGTSFSAPLAASVAGQLLYRADDSSSMTPQTAKALMIHKGFRDGWTPQWGWGALTSSVEDMMLCTQGHVTLLYNGELPLGKHTALQIPFYSDIAERGSVRLSWTLVYATDVASNMPDEYTLGGAQIYFRPNCDVFTYFCKKENRTKTINRSDDPNQFAQLVEKGTIKDNRLPKTESPKKKNVHLTEEQRRNHGVWDTAKHYWTGFKRFSSLKDPMIDIHAQARSDWYYDKARPSHLTYACVVSIELKNKSLPLYQTIRERVPELVEIRLRDRAKIRV
ncbi:S8 family peptidase [Halodesulfovibrio sp.]|uniref:S8 family peptidase n=1 Tax=Halodesulfovibrio sp. TaxID=1912772 RepID=UPI0025BBE128|nr:S8 family peptidase [Halodesulfovibrio sp.]